MSQVTPPIKLKCDAIVTYRGGATDECHSVFIYHGTNLKEARAEARKMRWASEKKKDYCQMHSGVVTVASKL